MGPNTRGSKWKVHDGTLYGSNRRRARQGPMRGTRLTWRPEAGAEELDGVQPSEGYVVQDTSLTSEMPCTPYLQLEKLAGKRLKTLVLMHDHIAGLVGVGKTRARDSDGCGIANIPLATEGGCLRQDGECSLDIKGPGHCDL